MKLLRLISKFAGLFSKLLHYIYKLGFSLRLANKLSAPLQ